MVCIITTMNIPGETPQTLWASALEGATFLPHSTYASSLWWGFINRDDRRLNSVLAIAVKQGYLPSSQPSFGMVFNYSDSWLVKSISSISVSQCVTPPAFADLIRVGLARQTGPGNSVWPAHFIEQKSPTYHNIVVRTTVVMATHDLHWKWQSLTSCQRHPSQPIKKYLASLICHQPK